MAKCLGDRTMTAGENIREPNRAGSKFSDQNRKILVLFLPFSCFHQRPSAFVSFRHLPPPTMATRIWEVWTMSRLLGDRRTTDGENIWEPNRPWPNFRIKSTDSRDVSPNFLLPSASVSFRHRPSASVSGDGDMSAGLDDVGRAYLETQQAMGGICGENRPILGMFRPIFRFRLPPSASASVCRRPF